MTEQAKQAGTSDQPVRRSLKFSSLDEIYQDAEMLHERGYELAGEWNLSQVCGHISDWMSFPMDGFPKPPFPISVVLWLMKVTMGTKTLRKTLAEGQMKAGMPTMKETVPKADLDEAKAVQRLHEMVERLTNWQDDFYASPLFGAMDREQLIKLQLIHSAHHLSFLVPK